MKKTAAVLVTLTSLLLCVISMQRQQLYALQSQSASSQASARQNETTSVNLAIAQRLPSFGFNNLIANWFFLQFLQYFGDGDVRKELGYALSPEYFRVIISNDPYFRLFYIFMSGTVSNFAGQPETSIELLNQGLEVMTPTFPNDSFYLWRYKAVDELLFLGDSAAARQSFQSAADWAQQSSHPDAPLIAENSQRTADFLAQNPYSRFAQISSWFSVLANAFDDATRQRAVDRIEALGGRIVPNEDGSFGLQLPPED